MSVVDVRYDRSSHHHILHVRFPSQKQKIYHLTSQLDEAMQLYAKLKSHYPFRKVGDKLPLWFDPNKPRNIKLPFSESCIGILLIVSGLVLIYLGIFIVKN